MSKIEAAVDCFRTGFVCSQAILSTYGEAYGLERDLALKVSSAFGGGVAQRAETCGAVTGALMVIGLRHGRIDVKDIPAKNTTYRVSGEFIERFTARNGSIVCKDLLGVDIGTPDGTKTAKENNLFKTLCPKFVRDAAEIIEAILR